ncbi:MULTISPECIES: YggS family pyridoxal phosphate-dependent enzyme [unclassified Arsukibacterium]|uniref:YggS family pyridoxal phosphate-dependent enzyme n=1 Tax=unclassified Arsukibacterium TaxID=2635278 RepID=UPI000C3FB992|nr:MULTISPECIES: YggS family pyridoxal phosphate-dependent enzyme [unclassified Arsukibacterium]MAA93339.1 YggS family pyridoxal phosphate-dependent enzyme [Rheinheimera sp.]MBM35281.1 YggS family pyridoxal phosphate-dependent enzyme [Rheinheimera sp.]HAW91899.1 YggS family pyridoxal phosphate-dependent enzyme [Candidatus Azambacteria bacterium]
MNNIAEQLNAAYHNITENCQKLGREPADVCLVAVSKTKPIAALMAAYEAGQRQFGENYPQELQAKATTLFALPELEWHFIGPLQSNKTRLIAEHASWVHSIDRLKIAERLSAQRPADLPPLQVLLQINISHEDSKAGIHPDQLPGLADAVAKLPQLQLRGLMAIPAPNDSKRAFEAMAQLSKSLQQQHPGATELSMGMSDDWPLALHYGATMIRLGTAIFGARTYERNE